MEETEDNFHGGHPMIGPLILTELLVEIFIVLFKTTQRLRK